MLIKNSGAAMVRMNQFLGLAMLACILFMLPIPLWAAAVAPKDAAAKEITTEMWLRASGILVLFVIIAVSIATRKLPAMVALPIMALGIGLLAGVPLMGKEGALSTILEGRTSPSLSGSFRLSQAIVYTLLGGMFARFVSDAGIAERIVKYAAEFGGENPFFITLMMSGITALIFTAIGGLPAIIMLGTVIFPVLLSLGVPAITCGGMLLMAFPIGAALSPASWATRATVFNIPLEDSTRFFLAWGGLQFFTLMAFLSIEFLRNKRINVKPKTIISGVLSVTLVAAAIGVVVGHQKLLVAMGATPDILKIGLQITDPIWLLIQCAALFLVLVGPALTQYSAWRGHKSEMQWNLLTPIMPLIFVLVLNFDDAIGPAFIAAMTYGFLTTPRPRGMQQLGKSMMNGVADVAAPVVIMLGIGMLIAAASNPKASEILTPIIGLVVPRDAIGYVIFFILASPLALYRGPLNEFGLGVGVATLLKSFIPPGATMGAIQSVGMLQDPTTTQNVWVAGYLKLDINAFLIKLFFYGVFLMISGLIMSALMFFPAGR